MRTVEYKRGRHFACLSDGTAIVSLVPNRCQGIDSFKVGAERKVVGDSCEGGWQPEKLTVLCPFNSKFTKGARSALGTMCMVGFALFMVTYMSRTDPLKKFFANSSFEALSAAPYSTIGTVGSSWSSASFVSQEVTAVSMSVGVCLSHVCPGTVWRATVAATLRLCVSMCVCLSSRAPPRDD